MPSANQKRIEELEAEVTRLTQANRRLEAEKYRLASYLNEIHTHGDALSGDECSEIAIEALNLTGALDQLQQRDLRVAHRTVKQMQFPVNIRKMWSGGEVQNWLQQFAEVLRQRALAQMEEGKDTVQ